MELRMKIMHRLVPKPAIVGTLANISSIVEYVERQDYTDIENKLNSFGRAAAADPRNTATFALEDDDGNIVRVVVDGGQAEDFEKALQQYVNDTEGRSTAKEIAEILYTLRTQFDIMDVNWPTYVEDEESKQIAVPAESEFEGNAEDREQETDDEVDDEVDAYAVDEPAPAADPTELLQQIINMMTADATARAKEAEAKEAEAEARLQAINNQQLVNKVRQEEQILDMEADLKAKKERDKETKRLAQLAHWKSDMARNSGMDPDDASELATDEIFGTSAERMRAYDQEDEQSTLFKGIISRPMSQGYNAAAPNAKSTQTHISEKPIKNTVPRLTKQQVARMLLTKQGGN